MPQRRTLFQQLNFQKCPEHEECFTFWLPDLRWLRIRRFKWPRLCGNSFPNHAFKGAFNIRGMGLIHIHIYIYIYYQYIINISYHIISYHIISYHIISYHTYHYLSQITKNINPSSRAAPQLRESPLDGSGSRRLEKSWSVSCLVMCMKQHVVKSC